MEHLEHEPRKSSRRHFLKIAAVSAGAGAAMAKLMEQETDEERIIAAIEKVKWNCVMVQGVVIDPFRGEGHVTGSGTIVKDQETGEMFICTNAHVTEESGIQKSQEMDEVYKITLWSDDDREEGISFYAPVEMQADGTRCTTYAEEGLDMSLLRIPANVELPEECTGIEMRDFVQEPPVQGETVLTIGNPYAMPSTVGKGIISHKDRFWQVEHANRFLFTDSQVSPGNSGGLCCDDDGKMLGIPTWGVRNEALSGCIRMDTVKPLLEKWGVKCMSEEERDEATRREMAQRNDEEKEEGEGGEEDAKENANPPKKKDPKQPPHPGRLLRRAA